MVSLVNQILSVITIVSQIFLVVGVIYFLIFKKETENPVTAFFGRNGMKLALLIVIGSISASLFYSNYAGFEPCVLCWWQRIAMYPLLPLLGIALYKRDEQIIDYGLVFAAFGALIALYQNYLTWGGNSLFPCDALGVAVSCTKLYVFEFGYITIPIMSLTGFLLVIFFLFAQKFNKK